MLFDVVTPLGFSVHCTRDYWKFLVAQKHPVLLGHEAEVQAALTDPLEIRRSRQDKDVYLFYRGVEPRWICAVVRHEGQGGFLITAYPADKIKIGDVVWKKSS